jgi:hypothetical protein
MRLLLFILIIPIAVVLRIVSFLLHVIHMLVSVADFSMVWLASDLMQRVYVLYEDITGEEIVERERE